MNKEIRIDNHDLFYDRELSWLDFNRRVLDEASDPTNPILERLKFLCITESNLDEFYMVRVAGIRELVMAGHDEKSMNGMKPLEILFEISQKARKLVKDQQQILNDEVLPELRNKGISIIEDKAELLNGDIQFLKIYYKEEVSGILTPLAIDPAHPFPHILNKTLNLAITLTEDVDLDNGKFLFAVVQVPSVLPRFVELPSNGTAQRRFFPLEKIIEIHLEDLFYGMQVKEIQAFKISRDSDISIREDSFTGDLLTFVKKELKNRIWGDAVRLDISSSSSGYIRSTLRDLLGLQDYEVFEVDHIINLTDLMFFYGLGDTGHLKFPNLQPKNFFGNYNLDKIFQLIRKDDIMFHHPYDSFQAVEDLLKFASQDPKVLAIKMTLYRTSGDSPIIQYLKQAAENGKQVTVLVELKARFDEERNIMWAQRLEDSGVHVVYGVVGLKIHCKLLMIVRRESDRLRRYVHLSTGNYNSTTAKFYTDLSLFSQDIELTEEVGALFNVMTSFARMPTFHKIKVAPLYLRDSIIGYIQRETENAKKGKPSYIFLKMNSLVDSGVILALYQASNAGVKIDLVVRGICCLKAGIPGVSENISVRSIIGRFLEHSRIFIFENSGKREYYLSSADCMPRNFFKRIEVMFPIRNKDLKKRIDKIITVVLQDNVKARIMGEDGIYRKMDLEGIVPVDSQTELAKV
jgi:polyphosphate kinase